MLFDLQGKRRRVVQATYLTLAVLMGGGLVFFGVGGDAPGGLIDAITGSSGNDDVGNEQVQQRVEDNEQRVEETPRDPRARANLVRDYYALASGQTDASGTVTADGRDELQAAAIHWNAYLELADEPDPSLALVALQIFAPNALNQPESGLQAARILAEDRKRSYTSYMLLAEYAIRAGDERTEKLATSKALELAPKGQRKAVQDRIDQTKAAVARTNLSPPGQGGDGDGGSGGQGGGSSGSGSASGPGG